MQVFACKLIRSFTFDGSRMLGAYGWGKNPSQISIPVRLFGCSCSFTCFRMSICGLKRQTPTKLCFSCSVCFWPKSLVTERSCSARNRRTNGPTAAVCQLRYPGHATVSSATVLPVFTKCARFVTRSTCFVLNFQFSPFCPQLFLQLSTSGTEMKIPSAENPQL